ncbi:hypothetical protein N9A45_00305 [bacterium]|nr:hypothetical protein [bacterium]
MSQPKDTTTGASATTTSAGASKESKSDDSKDTPKGAGTSTKKKKARYKPATWPEGPRTSIEHYEQVELDEGRMNPLFYCFWRNRYKFKKSEK